MEFFNDEVQRVLRSLEAHVDVTIVGPRGSGRTTTLHRIVKQAADLGLVSTTVWQSKILHRWDGEALHAVLGRVPGLSSPSVLAAALARELRESNTRLLVLDDEDWLDPSSRAAIDLALNETPVTLLTAQGHGTATTHPTSRLHRRRVQIDMPALQFDEVGAFMSDLLGGPVTTELIARVGSKTGGVVGLVRALAVSARDARRIALTEGTWALAADNLWNSEIHAHVGEMLAGQDDDALRAAHLLAMIGTAPVAEARSLVGDAMLSELARAHLITVIGAAQPRPVIALTPPLIVDYLRQRSVDVESVILADEVAAHTTVPSETLLPASRDVPGAAIEIGAFALDPVIARYLNDSGATRTSVHEQMWRDEPTLAHALLLLDSAWVSPLVHVDRRQLFAVTKDQDPEAVGSQEFTGHEAIWATFSERDLDAGLRVLQTFGARGESEHRWASWVSLLLRGTSVGITAEMLAEARRLRAEDDVDSMGRAVFALVHAIAGQGSAALEALDHDERWRSGIERFIARLAHGLALLSVGEEARLAAEARVGLSRARAQLDKLDIVVESYFSTYAAARLGDVSDAREALDLALLFNDLPHVLRSLQAGTSRTAALLALRNGWGVTPQALATTADQWTASTWPLPMAQPEFSAAARALGEGRGDLAEQVLTDAADGCTARGWVLAAMVIRIAVVRLAPSHATVDALARVREDCSVESQGQFVRFARQVLDEPERAEEFARAYRPDTDMYTAMLMLGSLRNAPDITVTAAHGLDAAAAVLREGLGGLGQTEAAGPIVDWSSVLSVREMEISLLTATLTAEQIADRLQLSMRTVNNHLANARRKTGTHSRAELLRVLRGGGAPGSGGG